MRRRGEREKEGRGEKKWRGMFRGNWPELRAKWRAGLHREKIGKK
jgi:hypothetical protein